MIELHNDDCRNVKIEDRGKYCIVTDPPFNIGYKYRSYKDKMREDEYFDLLQKTLTGGAFCIIHYPESIYKLAIRIGQAPDRVVTWCYNSNTKRQHRDIAFFGVQPDFSLVKQPYKNPTDKRIYERIANGNAGADMYDWFYINQCKNVSVAKTEHPCQMPLEVMKRVVGIIPKEYTIYDPFMGSGTTGVACVEQGRDFVGSEIDPVYFEIARRRIYKIGEQITFEEILKIYKEA